MYSSKRYQILASIHFILNKMKKTTKEIILIIVFVIIIIVSLIPMVYWWNHPDLTKMQILKEFPQSDYRNSLENLVHYTIQRKI